MRGMTKFERAAREQVIEELAKEGYVTYSNILSRFVLNLTSDPQVVGYMHPGKGIIVINQNLDMDQVSVVVRHEILHEMLQHMERSIKHMGKWKAEHNMMLTNIAGDYDISNQSYTEKDKMNMRAIKLNGAVLTCLVTEDQHPDWVNLTFEEMIDKLNEESEKIKQMQPQSQPLLGSEDDEDEDGDSDNNNEPDDSTELPNDPNKSKNGKSGKSASKSGAGTDNNPDNKDGQDDATSVGGKDNKDGKGKPKSWRDMYSEEEDPSSSEIQRKEAEERAKEIAKETAEEGADHSLDGVKGDVAEITKEFISKENMSSIEDENRTAKLSERQRRKEVDIQNKLNTGNASASQIAFKIKDFIAKEVGISRNREQTWGKPSRRGDNGPIALSRKGVRHRPNDKGKIPLIMFYFDQSGSWDESDVEKGMTIVNQLLGYERQGLLRIKIKYFSDHVYDDPDVARSRPSTSATHEIIDDAIKLQADNVVVMTDSDMDGQGYFDSKYIAPGAVWFIFRKGYECKKIQSHLRGRKLTKNYYMK